MLVSLIRSNMSNVSGSNASQSVWIKEDAKADILTVTYITACVFKAIVGAACIILNIFVLKCICCGTNTRSVTVTFLRHNAVADVLIGVFVFYHEVANLVLYENFYECVFRNACSCGVVLGSMFIIVGLNMERYLQITRPLRYMDIVRPCVVNTYLTLTWILVVGLSITPSLMSISATPVEGYCRFAVVMGQEFILTFCTLMCLVLSAQVFMYFHIFVISVTKIVKDRMRVWPTGAMTTVEQWWKPTKVVLVIVGTNAVTLAPISRYTRGKRARYDSVLWQKPLHSQKTPKSYVTSQNRHKKLRLHNDFGRT